MDKENAGRRASSQSATASSSSIRELATKLAVATKDGSRPKMGRDTAPVLLRLVLGGNKTDGGEAVDDATAA